MSSESTTMRRLLVAAGLIAGLAAPALAQNEAPVSRADWGQAASGGPWPLTVESGVIGCDRGAYIWFRTAGRTYSVNGSARTFSDAHGLQWHDIRAIWRDNPAIPGTKIPIAGLIQRGQTLCRPWGG